MCWFSTDNIGKQVKLRPFKRKLLEMRLCLSYVLFLIIDHTNTLRVFHDNTRIPSWKNPIQRIMRQRLHHDTVRLFHKSTKIYWDVFSCISFKLQLGEISEKSQFVLPVISLMSTKHVKEINVAGQHEKWEVLSEVMRFLPWAWAFSRPKMKNSPNISHRTRENPLQEFLRVSLQEFLLWGNNKERFQLLISIWQDMTGLENADMQNYLNRF